MYARALPDARDGLKPVHRRILYAMYDMGIRPDSPYKKSARIVGEVLGKYHPHGDAAVYEAMARMAQDFSMRYRLVDGQGNFGSVDGDAPAAMRYTEARLAAPAIQILADIQKNTVDFSNNFDGTLTEPDVLPAAVPNLLVNGATGIAVGMATSIPPHNLGEVIDALQFMLENWDKQDDLNVEDLMNFVHGPDFPTGGIIIQEEGSDSLISAYSTGRGRVTVQASAHLEEMERGRSRIIITELPYMTNKSSLIERIASLVREERLEGIADLRDESDRQGMRIVIELNKAAEPEAVLGELYKSTPMQSTFSIIMLALVDGEPRLLSLKQALRVFIEHRLEIVRRRSEFDLEKARQRAHILEGLLIALHNLDEIIALIRKSPDADTARDRMIKRFKLSTIQAQAILDMPLRRLAALERKKIEEEHKEVQALIKELTALLRSPKKIREVISLELQAVKEAFGDRRRTHIARLKAGESKVTMLTAADLKPEKQVWLTVSPEGLIARSLDDRPPQVSSQRTPLFLVQANARDTLYLVTEGGEAAAIAVHALPEVEDFQSGQPLHKVTALKEGQKLAGIFALPTKERRSEAAAESFVLSITRQGMLKKTSLSELPGPAAAAFTLVKVNVGDRLGWVRLTSGADEIVLVSMEGMAIRFNEQEVRPMGLVAAGVMGMKLKDNEELVGAELAAVKGELFLLASDGSAKRVAIEQFSRQGRYGQGIIAWKLPAKTRLVGATSGKGATRCVIHLENAAPKIIRLDQAPLAARAARGHALLDLKTGEQITSLCILPEAGSATGRATGKEDGGSGGQGSKKAAPKERKGTAKATAVRAEAASKPDSKPVEKSTQLTMEMLTSVSAGSEVEKPAATRQTKARTAAMSDGAIEKSGTATKPTMPAAGKADGKMDQPGANKAAAATAKAAVKSSPKTSTPPKTAAKPATPQAETKKASKPATKAAPKRTALPAEKPAAKTAAKPATTATSKTTARPVEKPAPKTAAKPATTATSKTTARPVEKPAAKTAAKPATTAKVKSTDKVAEAAPEKAATKAQTSSTAAPKSATQKTTAAMAPKATAQASGKAAAQKAPSSTEKSGTKAEKTPAPAGKKSTPVEKPAPAKKPPAKKINPS